MHFFSKTSFNVIDEADPAPTSNGFKHDFGGSLRDLNFAQFKKDTINDFDHCLSKRDDLNDIKISKYNFNNIPSLENIWSVFGTSLQAGEAFKKVKSVEKEDQHPKKELPCDFNVVPLPQPIKETKPSISSQVIVSESQTLQVTNQAESALVTSTEVKQQSKCTCANSKCLRLYCACFASGGVCGSGCQCIGCHNNDESSEIRKKIIKETLQKNPNAFKSKYKTHTKKGQVLHVRGCNCSKTGCIKEYCECFKMGSGCSPLCKCVNCKNQKVELDAGEMQDIHVKAARKRKKTKYFEEHFGCGSRYAANKENKPSKD